MQPYLPEELYDAVKARGLPASELFQRAVRAEIRRLELLEKTDAYLESLLQEVGPPTAADRKRAEAIAHKLDARHRRRAG